MKRIIAGSPQTLDTIDPLHDEGRVSVRLWQFKVGFILAGASLLSAAVHVLRLSLDAASGPFPVWYLIPGAVGCFLIFASLKD